MPPNYISCFQVLPCHTRTLSQLLASPDLHPCKALTWKSCSKEFLQMFPFLPTLISKLVNDTTCISPKPLTHLMFVLVGGMAGPRALTALERQLSGSSNMTAGAASGPGASRHLSGDAGLASLQLQPQGYRNVGRHLSGDQVGCYQHHG